MARCVLLQDACHGPGVTPPQIVRGPPGRRPAARHLPHAFFTIHHQPTHTDFTFSHPGLDNAGRAAYLGDMTNKRGNFTAREKRVLKSVRLAAGYSPAEWARKREVPPECFGLCYIAAEAAYHALGGSAAGYKPMSASGEWGTHWWVRTPGGANLDPTAVQFGADVLAKVHARGRGRGFLTREPSKRARVLMARLGKGVTR